MKLYLLFIIFNIKFIFGLNQESTCTSFINIKSSINQSPCGNSLENACSSFTLANQTCNIQSFDQVVYYFSPGTYSFANIDTFGPIKNKDIQILNQNYSTTTSSSNTYTSVIFNLSGSLNSFFNIISQNYSSDISNITVNGITFVNGFQNNSASVLLNNGTGSFNFVNCIFENNLSGSIQKGGSILFLQQNGGGSGSNLTISNCIYQNTNSSNISGGFIFIDQGLKVNIYIDSTIFTNTIVSTGPIISVNTYNKNSLVSITNSNFNNGNITNWNTFTVKSNTQSYISNITFNQNIGGTAFGIFGENSKFLNSKFQNNINTTAIKYITSSNPGIIISDCLFTENRNYENLGFGEGSCIQFSNSYGTINNCQFINNYAITGSAIYLSSTIGGTASIINSTFNSNSANQGAIYTLYSTISFNGTNTFTNNYAQSGSAIYCTNSDIYLGNSSTFLFKNNTDVKDNSLNGVTCGSTEIRNECTFYGNFSNICNSTESNSSDSNNNNSQSGSNDNNSSHNNSESGSKDNSSSQNNSESGSKDNNSSSHNNSEGGSSKENSSSQNNSSNSGSQSNNNSNDKNKKDKLSSGSKAAIAISVIFGFIGLVIITIFILRRNKLRKGYIPIAN